MTVPDAAAILALPWRDMADVPRDGSIVAVWFRPWNYEPNDPRIQFAQWIDVYGNGGKLCAPWNYDSEPHANGWLPLDELPAINAPIPSPSSSGGES